MVRGVLLSESWAGERSLLFRWHYATATGRMVIDHPVVGTGIGGYRDAYLHYRSPRNPEEVASPHSTALDWTATLVESLMRPLDLGRGQGPCDPVGLDT